MKFKFSNLIKGEKELWVAYLFLTLISIVEVYSAASTLSYKSGDYTAPLIEHLGHILLGAGCLWFTTLMPTKYLKLVPGTLLPISWILLIVVLIFTHSVNGASRMLLVTEMAKISTVVAVARILSSTQLEHNTHPKAMKWILIVTAITCVLIVLENLSSAALVAITVFLMMIAGRVPFTQIFKLLAVCILALGTAVLVCWKMPDSVMETLDEFPLTHRVSTWVARVKGFLEEKDEGTYDIYGKDSQRIYADLAIQEGGVLGKGPGNSRYRDFLPQAYSDFIYAIIIEETGILGGGFVFLMFVVIFIRSIRIALRAPTMFGTFLVTGLSVLLLIQALVNMAVAVGAMPITGQPLPFVSRGGWSIVSSCTCLGIIIGVSRNRMPQMDTKQ